MRVLLVNPPDVDGHLTDREDRHAGFCSGLYPPYTAASILGVLRQRIPDLDLQIFDARLENLPVDQGLQRVHALKPDLIICLLGTYTLDDDRPYAELEYPTIGVICPSSVDPKEAIELFGLTTPYFTKTEIENTLAEAVKEFQETGDIRKTPGMVLQQGNQLVDTGASQFQSVTEFAMPAFDLLPMDEFFRLQKERLGWHWEFGRNRYMWMVTSKGCVKQCTYCSSSTLRPFYKTPQQVVDEIRHYIDTYQVRHFDFIDSEFTVNVARAKEICQGFIDAKFNIKWVAHNIIELVDEEMMRLMGEAGCLKLKYGLETADPEIQRRILKPWSIPQAKKAFDLTKKYGMKAQANFMVGFLGETKETLKQTHRAFVELEPDIVCSSILFPTPSTAFYEELKARDLLLVRNWSEYKKYGKMIFKHDHYTTWEDFQNAWAWLEARIARSLAWKQLFRRNGQPFLLKVMNVIKADPKLKRGLQRLPLISSLGTLVSRRFQLKQLRHEQAQLLP